MIYLAPLQGLTDLPFRKAYSQLFTGVMDYAVSPFISLTQGDMVSHSRKLKEIDPAVNPISLPLIPQLLGNHPQYFLSVSNSLYAMGYQEVNWNLGCPAIRVANKKRGSGLLPYPELIDAFLNTVFTYTKTEVSLKIRLGYESENEICKLLPIFQKYPIRSLTIHPRIGIQMYEGNLYVETVKQCMPFIHCPVIFNGDIRNVEDARSVYSNFPQIKDLMIGRGLLINPLLAGELKGVVYPHKAETTKAFVLALFEELKKCKNSDKAVLNKMKEYGYYLSQNFKQSTKVLERIQSQNSLKEMENTIRSCYEEEVIL